MFVKTESVLNLDETKFIGKMKRIGMAWYPCAYIEHSFMSKKRGIL